jgi:hypothetical protein
MATVEVGHAPAGYFDDEASTTAWSEVESIVFTAA